MERSGLVMILLLFLSMESFAQGNNKHGFKSEVVGEGGIPISNDSMALAVLYDSSGRLLADSSLKLSEDGLRLWTQNHAAIIHVLRSNVRNHPLLVEAGMEFKILFELTLKKNAPPGYTVYRSSINLREGELSGLIKENEKMFTLLENILRSNGVNQSVKFYIPVKFVIPDHFTDENTYFIPSAGPAEIRNGWVISRPDIKTVRNYR